MQFLFASPICFFQKNTMSEFTQINWKKELKSIKDLARKKNLGLRIECSVATRDQVVKIVTQRKMRVLHVSCHGIQEQPN